MRPGSPTWPMPNESASTASRALLDAAVWFAERGIRIERVLTDNASAYTSPTFARAIESIGARHKRTRPHRPQTNGKAERFIKTLLTEWAYGRLYRTNAERIDALPACVDFYNAGGPTPPSAAITPRRCQQRPWGSHLAPTDDGARSPWPHVTPAAPNDGGVALPRSLGARSGTPVPVRRLFARLPGDPGRRGTS